MIQTSDVKAVLRETDGTDDPEWLDNLCAQVEPYSVWRLQLLDPSTLDNPCTDYKTAREYARDIESAPPIVVIPDDTGKLTQIVDGGHRALAAAIAGVKVLALVPVVPLKRENTTPQLDCGALPIQRYGEVYHVGFLDGALRGRAKQPNASFSLEGPGLSVSVYPSVWKRYIRSGGSALYALERKDGREGQFVDLTNREKVEATYARPALARKLLVKRPVFRLWQTDEYGDETYQQFQTREAALREVEDDDPANYNLEQVEAYVAGRPLTTWYRRYFTRPLSSLYALDMAALYLVERVCLGVDGAWWHEELVPHAYSAPRGVIFRARLPEWNAFDIAWDEAPDADIFDDD